MASLEKIRNRSGLLIGFIGVALAAFVLGDLFSSGNRLFGGNNQILGEVNGDVIEQKDFEIELQEVTGLQGPNANQNDIRTGLWNDKVDQLILNSEYDKSGLSITTDELTMITIGLDNHEIDPVVKQIFGIQPGQEVTSQQLSAYLNQLQENEPKRWAYIQNVIQKQRLNGKLNTLIANSYIATTAEAEAFYTNSGKTASGSFVYKSYASVDEANKTVTDADLKAYYNAHKSEFERNESRRVQYAIFDIAPSANDNAAIRKEIEKLKETQIEYNSKFSVYDTIPGFETTPNMDGFLRENSDKYYDPTFKAKGQLPATFDELMHTNEIGFVYGPFFDAGSGSYQMARLMDKRNDSVQVAVLVMDVVSSDETDNLIFKKASAFAMNLESGSFEEAIKTIDGGKPFTESITQDDRQFNGLGNDKQLMRWAFKSSRELGEITRFTMDGKYVIARLDAKLAKGISSFEDIKDQLTPAAKIEKAKSYLLEQLAGSNSLADASSKLGEEIKPFSGLAFAGNTLEGAGYEPVVVGAIMGLPTNTVSSPIGGTSGVVIAEVNAVTEAAASNDYKAMKSQIENAFIPRVSYELTPALKEKADIKDFRADFY